MSCIELATQSLYHAQPDKMPDNQELASVQLPVRLLTKTPSPPTFDRQTWRIANARIMGLGDPVKDTIQRHGEAFSQNGTPTGAKKFPSK